MDNSRLRRVQRSSSHGGFDALDIGEEEEEGTQSAARGEKRVFSF